MTTRRSRRPSHLAPIMPPAATEQSHRGGVPSDSASGGAGILCSGLRTFPTTPPAAPEQSPAHGATSDNASGGSGTVTPGRRTFPATPPAEFGWMIHLLVPRSAYLPSLLPVILMVDMDLLLDQAEMERLQSLLADAMLGWCVTTPAGAMVPVPIGSDVTWATIEPSLVDGVRQYLVWLPAGCFLCSEEQEHMESTIEGAVEWLVARIRV